MFGLGARELFFFADFIYHLFGANKIPYLDRGISEYIMHIRNGFSDEEKGKTGK
jgi:hypothetical protein